MPNTLITPVQLLREAGRIFHQKARFIPRINRRYSDEFAREGAKTGASIQLRDANEYTVSTSATLAVQDTTEAYQTLTINKRAQVGLNFTSQDLTLSLDDFSERYIAPAASRIVAKVESDVVDAMKLATANLIDSDAAAFAYLDVAKAKQKLDETLTPPESRSVLLCPTHATKYLDASKGFYNPKGKLGDQYDSGIVEDFTGFDIGATTHLVPHTTGTAVGGDTLWNISAASQIGASITVDTGTLTLKQGDVVTLAGCNAVHPETKADLGYLKQFTVTADFSASPLLISPAIVATGAKQNVTASPTNAGAVSKLASGTSASQTMVESLAFHKDAFVFASVDLEDMSKYGGWGGREVIDGLSMRVWRQGDIVNDAAPCRLDILYGYLARYPQMACRMHADG
jgi:hypothetical protein